MLTSSTVSNNAPDLLIKLDPLPELSVTKPKMDIQALMKQLNSHILRPLIKKPDSELIGTTPGLALTLLLTIQLGLTLEPFSHTASQVDFS